MSAHKKLKAYTLTVAAITPDGARAGDEPTLREWRQKIERAVEAKAAWVALSGWNRTTLTDQTAYDRGALTRDFNYGLVTFVVEVIEPRG